jgi:hypothetical protein
MPRSKVGWSSTKAMRVGSATGGWSILTL